MPLPPARSAARLLAALLFSFTSLGAAQLAAQQEGTGASAARWERLTPNARTAITIEGDLSGAPEVLAWVQAYEEREHTSLEGLGAYERAERAAAAPDDPFEPLTCEGRWVVSWTSGDLVSLYREVYVYTGGAHGFTAFDSLLWDRAQGGEVPLAELLVDPSQDGEAMTVLRRELVASLKDEVELRLGVGASDLGAIGEEGARVFAPGSEALGRFAVIAGHEPGSVAAFQWYVAEGRVEATATGAFSPRVACATLQPYLTPEWAGRCEGAPAAP
jgi:hypothetical protein